MKDYKILLVCSGGMSTTILMAKMQKYAEEQDISLVIDACAASAAPDRSSDFSIILLGPQIAYQKTAIAGKVSIPVVAMQPQDYAMARCANIIKQVDSVLGDGGPEL